MAVLNPPAFTDFFSDHYYHLSDIPEIELLAKNRSQELFLLRWRFRGLDRFKVLTLDDLKKYNQLCTIYSAVKFSRKAIVQDTGLIDFNPRDRRGLVMMDSYIFNSLFGAQRTPGLVFNWMNSNCFKNCLINHSPLAEVASFLLSQISDEHFYPSVFLRVPIAMDNSSLLIDFIYLNDYRIVTPSSLEALSWNSFTLDNMV
jgi:hypothetical protein